MAKEEATLLIKIKEAGSDILDRVVITLGDIIGIVKSVSNAIVGFGVRAIESYGEQEQAVNKLNQSMVQQGIFSKALSDDYQKQATQLQRLTTFGDEQIISAQGTLQQFIGQQKVTQELTLATLNLAQAKGIDLNTAAQLVGKTIGSETNALSRLGIEVDSNASKQEKLQAVIEGINAKMGGQAEAAALGTGRFAQFNNAVSDVFESIGERLAPSVVELTKLLIPMVEWLGVKAVAAADILRVTLQVLAEDFVIIKNTILGFVDVMQTGFGGTMAAIAQAIVGDFSGAAETLKSITDQMAVDVIARQTQTREELAAINAVSNASDESKNQAHLDKLSAQSDKQRATQNAAIQKDQLQLFNMKKVLADAEKKTAEDTADDLVKLSQSKNSVLAGIGKAFALRKIAQDTASGAIAAYSALAGIPFVGPALGAAAAGALIAFGAEQAGKVLGLAQGGIVRATPGGVPAIIGEGGRDEAVIPLDEGGAAAGLGMTINLTINGGLLGDESSARELAMAIDKQLLRLRQNNESQSFGSLI